MKTNRTKNISSKKTTTTSKGQSLVEFALYITIVFLLISVSIDAGRLILAYQGLVESAREGAVYGSVSAGSDEEIITRSIQSEPSLALSSDNVSITYTGNPCAGNGNIIVVSVHKHVPLIMPLTSIMFPDGIDLHVQEKALIITPVCP